MTDSCYLPRGAHSVSTCGGSSGGGGEGGGDRCAEGQLRCNKKSADKV